MPLTRDQERKKTNTSSTYTHNKTITFYQIKYTLDQYFKDYF